MVMASIEALNEYMPARATGGEASYTVGQRIGAERTGPDQPRQGRLNPSRGSHHRHATRFQWDINLNTANRTQIAAYLAQTTDLEAFAANLAVALIVKLRGFQTFGLDEDQVGAICRFGELVHAHGRRTYPHFDRQRREQDRLTGAEGFLNWYVDRLLEVETNQRYFQHHGIATRA